MKPISFVVCLILLCAGLSQAQDPGVSVTGGFNIARWKLGYKSTSFENKARLGLFGGVQAEFPFLRQITFQGEIMLAQFGANFKDGNEYAHYKTSYLLLPFLVKYHFDHGITVMAGPQIGLLLSAHSDIDGETRNFKEDMKKGDLFLVLGATYKLKSGLALGFRINHGLTNVEHGASTSLHNRGFMLTAEYRFRQSLKEMLKNLF